MNEMEAAELEHARRFGRAMFRVALALTIALSVAVVMIFYLVAGGGCARADKRSSSTSSSSNIGGDSVKTDAGTDRVSRGGHR